jgi:hypothetical protein
MYYTSICHCSGEVVGYWLRRVLLLWCGCEYTHMYSYVGGGNLFLTLVSIADQSGSMMFKSGDCVGKGKCWNLPSCSSNHDGTVPAVWMGALSSWKTTSLFGNNYHLDHGANRILYHDIVTQTITDPPLCFTVRIRHSGL